MLEPFNGFGIQKQDSNVTEKRNVYVGGSDVPVILGLSKYKTQFEMAKEKIGLVKRDYSSNPYTRFGDILEPHIRDYINTINDTNFIVTTYIDEERSIRSNVDGIDLNDNILLEIKTHGKNPTKEVYKAQMQTYMVQTGCEIGWLAMYERPENFDTDFDAERLIIEEVPADKEYQNKILDSIETFWVRCEFLKENPEMTEQEFMTIGTDMDLALAKLNKLTPELLKYKELMKHLESQEKELKDMLYEKMTENDIKKIETPFFVVNRILPTKSKRFDSKRFKVDNSDLYQQYEVESERKGYIKLIEKEHE